MPVIICDAEGGILYANRRFGALSGSGDRDITPDQSIETALKSVERQPSEDPGLLSFWRRIKRNLECGHSFEFVGQDGQTYFVIVEPLEHHPSEFAQIAWYFSDITDERAQAENYERVYTQSAIGIFRSTPDGQYIAANPAAVRLHGYDSEQELLQAVGDVGEEIYVRPQDRIALRNMLEKHGEAFGFECEIYRHKTGERCWVRQNIWKISDNEGRLRYLEGHVEDITERKNFELGLSDRIEERTAALRTANKSLQAEIEERTQAEAALKENELLLREREALFHSIIDNSPSVIVVKDLDGRFVFVNQSFVNARGGTVENWIGKEAYSSSPPDHAAAMRAQDREAIELQTAVTRERRTTLLDGMPYHMIVTKFPVNDADGALVGVASISTDVRELYQTRRALEISEERLRSIVDNSPSAIFLKGLDGTYQLANKQFGAWHRKSPEEIVGAKTHDLYPEELAKTFSDHDRKVLETRRGFEREIETLFADGEHRVVHATKFPVLGPDGEIVGIGVIGTDITERKHAESALRDSETLLRAIIDNMPALVSLKDAQGRYLLANKGFESTTGVSADDAIGRTTRDLGIEDAFVDRVVALDQKVLETGQVVGEEDEVVMARGVFVRSLTKFPVFDTSGNIRGVGTVSVDVSDRKAMEAQLQQAQKMEAVGQLTGGVAHDFNNLLGVIIGNLDLLGEALKSDSGKHKLIESALRAALRGADLTGRLLAFSRKQALRPEVLDLNALVLGMTDLLRRTLGETISIRSVAAPGLWFAQIDPGQMEAALLNLAVNARHAMAGGGQLTVETANVELSERLTDRDGELEPGRYVMLAVTDTGTGIPADKLEHVFEPFFTTKGVGEGSGLGLSMVHGFVKQSDGHVTIQSEQDTGTAVRLYFPVADGEPAAADDSAFVNLGPRGAGETILIVEDDPDLRKLAVKTVSGLGYDTLQASDGESALAVLAKGTRVDLLFTDVVLPGGMNGVALGETVSKSQPGIKILYTSGYTENAVPHKSILRSGDELLIKPYRREVLAHRLWHVLNDD